MEKKSGRPRAEINWETFESLCGIQCTQTEIASVLKVHVDTLRDRTAEHYQEDFSTVYKKFSEGGKCSLRRNQFMLSKTNASMAIWLGKQWLGQTDVNKEQVGSIVDAVLEINERNRNRTTVQQRMETEQPLLHQRSPGESDSIQA